MGGLSTSFMRIVLLVIPGVAARMVYRRLTHRRAKRDWEEFLSILVFALWSYAACGLLGAVKIRVGVEPPEVVETLNALYTDGFPINWMSVFWATVLGVVLAFPSAAIENHKLVTKLGRLVRVTNRYGDEDVWDYLHSSDDVKWVVVRDHKLDLMYYGCVVAFSDSGGKRELLLEDVDVYSQERQKPYHLKGLYISRDDYDLSIDIPDFDEAIDREEVSEVAKQTTASNQ